GVSASFPQSDAHAGTGPQGGGLKPDVLELRARGRRSRLPPLFARLAAVDELLDILPVDAVAAGLADGDHGKLAGVDQAIDVGPRTAEQRCGLGNGQEPRPGV